MTLWSQLLWDTISIFYLGTPSRHSDLMVFDCLVNLAQGESANHLRICSCWNWTAKAKQLAGWSTVAEGHGPWKKLFHWTESLIAPRPDPTSSGALHTKDCRIKRIVPSIFASKSTKGILKPKSFSGVCIFKSAANSVTKIIVSKAVKIPDSYAKVPAAEHLIIILLA